MELWGFINCQWEGFEQTVELPVNWKAMALMCRHCNIVNFMQINET